MVHIIENKNKFFIPIERRDMRLPDNVFGIFMPPIRFL